MLYGLSITFQKYISEQKKLYIIRIKLFINKYQTHFIFDKIYISKEKYLKKFDLFIRLAQFKYVFK